MNNLQSLDSMTALVTGASSGIGAATAVALAARGAKILVHYNSRTAEAERILQRVASLGVDGELLRADLSNIEGVRCLVGVVKDREIDILVNNAGSLIERTCVLDFTEDLWNRVTTLNLTSAFLLSQAVLGGMKERRRGFIVNVSSVAARTGGGLGASAYAASKGAVSTMTKSLAKEFAPFGIRVNAVSPGTIDTDYHRRFSNHDALESVIATTPAGRLGTSEEIADAVVFLCSKEACFIHGQIIEINGGFLMA